MPHPSTEGDSKAQPMPKKKAKCYGNTFIAQEHLKLLGNPLFSGDLEDGRPTDMVSGHVTAGRTHRALLAPWSP